MYQDVPTDLGQLICTFLRCGSCTFSLEDSDRYWAGMYPSGSCLPREGAGRKEGTLCVSVVAANGYLDITRTALASHGGDETGLWVRQHN
jgi:hypothetical protein